MTTSSSFQDLRIWQDSMDLTVEIYRATTGFPRHEAYGLISQMQRAAVSVPSNIAEGKGHRSDPEFVRFLFHARGSLLELQTQLLIARRLQYLSEEKADELCRSGDSIARGLKLPHQQIPPKGGLTPATNDQRPATVLSYHTLHAF
jgi:four helix bundle protein